MARYKFDAERLAYWYLRLNGFLTTENFVIHDESTDRQRTDIDLVAVRLPYRAEGLRDYGDSVYAMTDDPRLVADVPLAAFVEVTTGRCKVNGPWTEPEQNNIPRALRALGAFPETEVTGVARELYLSGRYADNHIAVSIMSLGREKNPALPADVLQITWTDVTQFIFDRFDRFKRIKRQHPQWDMDGHLLWRVFEETGDASRFAEALVLVTEERSAQSREQYISSRIYGGRP